MENLIIIQKEELKNLLIDCVSVCLRQFNLQTQSDPEELLTRREAAELLRITLPTLHNYTLSGKIQGSRIGRRVLYKKQDLDKAVKAMQTSK